MMDKRWEPGDDLLCTPRSARELSIAFVWMYNPFLSSLAPPPFRLLIAFHYPYTILPLYSHYNDKVFVVNT
jgi:hypothetical protein